MPAIALGDWYCLYANTNLAPLNLGSGLTASNGGRHNMSKTTREIARGRRMSVESKHICPLCGGTGCDREPLTSAEQVAFLFPRCELCGGLGRLAQDQYQQYLMSLDGQPRVVVRRGKDPIG